MGKSTGSLVARLFAMAVMAAALLCWFGPGPSRALAESPQNASGARSAVPQAAATCAGTNLTLTNHNPYPIWLGENVNAGAILTPSNGDWELNSGATIDLCVPPDWTSGVFWARTECDFAGTFGQDKDSDYVSCTVNSDCTSPQHICMGGKCVWDCSTSTGTNGDCGNSTTGLTGSVCVAAAGSSKSNFTAGSYCGFQGGVCRTGDCGSGLYQCQGTWNGNQAKLGPGTPSSLFEITNSSAADGGQGASNYDVSNVSGYNNAITVTPTSNGGGVGSCQSISCSSDLNETCPALLQVLEPPVPGPSPSGSNAPPCGAGYYCKSGTCIACPTLASSGTCINNQTCDIGCAAPATLCASSYPSPISAPGTSDLDCTSILSGGNYDGSEYQDMYNAANKSGVVDSNHLGAAMFSGNQGTPTCWGDLDCQPNEECVMGSANTGIAGLPSDVGVCAIREATGSPRLQPQTGCATTADADAHNHCGGYPNSPVYTCVQATNLTMITGGSGVACLPAFNPPTYGIGTYDSGSGLYTGIGAPLNPEWNAAALWASGDGTNPGTTPYYETFSNACPHQYAWTYDDHAGGFACNAFPVSLDVTFGLTTGLGASPGPVTAPVCSPDGYDAGYLVTNPSATLSFPGMDTGTKATESLTVTNNAGGTLRLHARIRHLQADDFSLAGGTCKSIRILSAGASCTYLVKLKADRDDAGGALGALMKIKGEFVKDKHSKPHRVCPRGVFQGVTVTLTGYVNPK